MVPKKPSSRDSTAISYDAEFFPFPISMTILLTTANARYSHTALGIRSLCANLGEWRERTHLMEFTLDDRAQDIAEQLLAMEPVLIGFSVYIWNVSLLTEVALIIKAVKPSVILVVGGPEVSYEWEQQAICHTVDYVVAGAGEYTFPPLLEKLFTSPISMSRQKEIPLHKFIAADPRALHKLDTLTLPSAEYSDEDIRHRHVYFEASRGCPFKCEFCLSSLDVSAFPFPLEKVIASLEKLWERGLRRFKFVDRTFNLAPKVSTQILDWFLEKNTQTGDAFFTHFEMIPDRLPPSIRERLRKFPKGSLQLEIGIQSWNESVQALISRKQDNTQTEENLRYLLTETHAHLHTDLIIGLPGETLESLAAGFSRLWRLGVHEIQVGILKRLRGTPIHRHTENFSMVYMPNPPYALIQNHHLNFQTMQRLMRFARYWDVIGNSGRFANTLSLILSSSNRDHQGAEPFWQFMRLSEGIYRITRKTHQIALERWFDTIFKVALEMGLAKEELQQHLTKDYAQSGARGNPEFLSLSPSRIPNHHSKRVEGNVSAGATPKRQQRHRPSSH